MGEANDGVHGAESAEVAVGRLGWMDRVGGDPQRSERGSDLRSHQPALAQTRHQDRPAGVGTGLKQ